MVFDAHSDIWSDVTQRSLRGERDILRKYHLPRLKKGGIEGSVFVVWVDPPYDKTPYERTEQIFDAVRKEIADCDAIQIVRNYEEMMAAKEAGKFYVFVGMEGLSSIGENLDLIDTYYDLGARTAMLSWNEENLLATGARGNPKRGLTPLGKQAVAKLTEKKMLIDVSHLNEKSFWDVAEIVNEPFIASHSNAKALCDVPRNLSDQQLLRIRDANGVVGINAFYEFLSGEEDKQTLDTLVGHMVYIAEKIGVAHLGCGFDFFEFLNQESMSACGDQKISATRGFEDCSKVPMLLEKLKKVGFTDQELEMIAYRNFHRVIKQVLK